MKAIYLLIAITAGGNISKVEFDSLAACENAKSLALYGETTEEYKKKEESLKMAEKSYEKEFYKKHPPRDPRTKEEKAFLDSVIKSGGWLSSAWGPCSRGEICGASVTKDGKIQDLPGPFVGNGSSGSYYPKDGEWIQETYRGMVVRSKYHVKTAECIPEREVND